MELIVRLNHRETRVVLGRLNGDVTLLQAELNTYGNKSQLSQITTGAHVDCPDLDSVTAIVEICQNKVAPTACPICNEADIDKLVFDTQDNVHCSFCKTVFDPNAPNTVDGVLYRGEVPEGKG